MEGIIYNRVTPIIKCVVLFLFIFTAKVLTSRPQESLDIRNEIQHLKPSHYVRTFTKYHHRRTIQWNNLHDYWPTQDHPKVIHKRSVEALGSDEFVNTDNIPNQFAPDSIMNNNVFDKPIISIGKENQSSKNGISSTNTFKINKHKTAQAPPTKSPTITCVYKPMAMSTTPSYAEEKNEQQMVENESFEIGPLRDEMVNGEMVKVEVCTDPQAYCFTVWEMAPDGNSTVLGQGCWRPSSRHRRGECGVCRAVSPRKPRAKYCCCTTPNCNADYASIEEETVTMRVEAVAEERTSSNVAFALGGLLAVCAAAVLAAVLRCYCRKRPPEGDCEKGEVMGSGPDALATGLLCVDNLALIEHIGQGKFGSVWRGVLGSTPVAVKLYSSAAAWQREAAVYALPGLAHPNILTYYGSDTRPTLTEGGGREHLIVVELCAGPLRARLQAAPLTWAEFAALAHGLAAALAHLHTPNGGKPCIVHRDVNSGNVLVSACGQARLADLGLACLLTAPRDGPPARITEAGTLRYLSPEALEGALDLSGARAALCAVDVFAAGLVLWEMLWRTQGAHPGEVPPYAPPYYHQGLPDNPTLAQMQNMVSRNKARPPLPVGAGGAGGAGGGADSRALRLAADTCDECWDHDAEARLTAVCVEERMCELKQMVAAAAHPPLIHDNNLHPHAPPDSNPPESDKNSNCTSGQASDVTMPLLYPHPHIGENISIERNTYIAEPSTVELLHRSTRDVPANTIATTEPRVQNVDENCLSVARTAPRPVLPEFENSERISEIRSYQRPLLDYVQNDVTAHDDKKPKQTNLQHSVKSEKPKWGIKNFFERKLGRNKVETEVKLMPESANANSQTKITVVSEKPSNVNFNRPANLVITPESNFDFEVPCTLSPPNRTLSPTMMMESDMNRDHRVFGFREMPRTEAETKNQNQIFAVIVPKQKPNDFILSQKRGSTESINKSVRTSMSSQSIFRSGNSESEDSTLKKRLSYDNRILSNSGRSSRASINLELQYIDNQMENYNGNDSPFDLNSDCSSSEDEHLMLLSENGGSKITMQAIPKQDLDKKKFQNEVLKESSQTKTDFSFNKFQNKYTNFDNEFSDPNDKENLLNGYSGDNPVYLAALNGEIEATELKDLIINQVEPEVPKSPKPSLKKLIIRRQHSLEQVSELFSSSGDVNLQNPAGRVKTPGDLPVAIRRARRDRALQKGRASESNRLSLYDDRMMFGNSL